jgi:phosphate-selective porin OprO/OprP
LWIEPKLTINKDVILNLQYDPTSRSRPINNLLFSYKGGAFTVTGGNFKEPFSFEQLMSNNDIMFMERSLADTFTPARNTGFAVGTHGENWTLSGGVFGGNINSTVDRGGLAGTVRATYAPVLTQTEVVHLGIAGSYRSLDRRGPDVSFDTSPESFLFNASLVDTGTIENARAIGRLGLEAAWANGPFRVQAEFIATNVERLAGRNVSFQGGYVQAAWVINGKSPRYALDADTATEIGVFKRVQPDSGQRVSHGGFGVFELAARYSVVDLSDRDIRGGFQQDVTAGLNWYPEPFIRLMANYIHAWADPTAEAVTSRPARADIGQIRLQIAF